MSEQDTRRLEQLRNAVLVIAHTVDRQIRRAESQVSILHLRIMSDPDLADPTRETIEATARCRCLAEQVAALDEISQALWLSLTSGRTQQQANEHLAEQYALAESKLHAWKRGVVNG